MKKNLIIFLFAIYFLTCNSVYSADTSDNSIEQKLRNIGLFSCCVDNDQKDIEQIIFNQTKYANSHNLKKLKNLYDENYHNFDGLSNEQFFDMISETWNSYTDLKYSSQIKKTTVNGSFADVVVIETTKGKTKNKCETTHKIGNIASESTVIYNLEKFGKTWKITSDNVLSEQTYLLYGDANNVAMNLYTPSQIAPGKKYNVIFDTKVPEGYFALGSITNETIVYPQKPPKEVFRNIKQDTVLERVVTSNTNNRNEYAIASIGLTKPSMTEDNQVHINIVGLGFLMNRVNVIPLNKGIN